MKKALITGITGQDGSYLSEFLLKNNYEVYGLIRRSDNLEYSNLATFKDDIKLVYGDLCDALSVRNIIDRVKPNEIYNLAAQSHLGVSYDMPDLTSDVNALGALRILESVKSCGGLKDIKYFQASTSSMFGNQNIPLQNEETPFYPNSPYSIAKLYAYWTTRNYRETFKMFACNGILFNHESPRRPDMFVTRKITKAFARIALGLQSHLELGNLDASRDWGHAKDYVRAMWMMLQHEVADDYVVASGTTHTNRDFCNYSAKFFNMQLEWEGSGLDEIARDAKTGNIIVKVNPNFYRPVDINNIRGDYTKINKTLGWNPEYSFEDIVNHMCENDLNLGKRLV